MPLAVAVSLLLALLVCQPGILLTPRLLMPLAVAVPLLLLGCGGHVVQIVSLAISGRKRL
jgi:hypothetical protein